MNGAKLKAVEIQGYKTFANKVLLDFPAAITAIVGPNGSGKSNVADAIRWVLGEQSFSLLRGRKTIDMIFSGSEQKARSGMASATIYFDNTDQWLPIDYSEVSVTRRAYRDGQNDYLLNGQKVRLKDVNELLGQSGLAERTYTIIGQGLIDTALALKADDRRKFFEEAAGIGLFRTRREEAMSRLDATGRNLERVQDILSELEPRTHSLERQAKRATEYEVIKRDLTALLREWYGFHWHQIQHLVLLSQERLRIQEEKTTAARLDMHQAEARQASQLAEIKEVRTHLGELHVKLSESHRFLETYNRENAVIDEKIAAGSTQKRIVQDETENIREEIELIFERCSNMEREQDEICERLIDAQTRRDETQRELALRQQERTLIQGNSERKRAELNETETDLIRFRAKADELHARLENLQLSSENQKNYADRSLQEADCLLISSDALKAEAEAQNLLVQSADEVVQKLRRQQNELENRQKALLNTLHQTQADAARQNARLEVLKEAQQNFSGLNQGAQFLLKNVKEGKIKQRIRSLEGIFLTAEKYETAVGAALGEYLDAVLMERSEWTYGVKLLNSGVNGRAVILSSAYDAKIPMTVNTGFGKPIRDFVRCEKEYASLAEQIFGHIIFVETFEQALTLQPDLSAGQSIVTLAGDIFRWNGSVASGNEGKPQILSRTRETRQLKENIAGLDQEILFLRDETAEINVEIEKNNQQMKDAQTNKEQVIQDGIEMRKRLNQAQADLEKQKQIHAFQEQKHAETVREIGNAETQIQTVQTGIAEKEAHCTLIQDEIKRISAGLNTIVLDDLQQQAQHWNVSVVVAEKLSEETRRRIADADQQLERIRVRQNQANQRINAIHVELEQLTHKKSDSFALAEQIIQAAKLLEDQINPAEIVLREREADHDRTLAEILIIRPSCSAAEAALSSAQLECTRQNDALERLKSKIEDDFGLVAFAYKETISGQTTLPLGTLIEELPVVSSLSENIEEQIMRNKGLLRRMGAINPEAITEFQEVRQRYDFLKIQTEDLKKADSDLRMVIAELDELMRSAFQDTFDRVQIEFKEMFTRLFGGGSAKLILTDPDHVNHSGIEIEAKLPGRRTQELSLLSGGERSLTSVALVFALLRVSPTPFCIMDEVDAALDESNVGRFCELLKDLSRHTQFILITHNRNTVEIADIIYGVTMGKDSVSQTVSLRLDEISKDLIY